MVALAQSSQIPFGMSPLESQWPGIKPARPHLRKAQVTQSGIIVKNIVVRGSKVVREGALSGCCSVTMNTLPPQAMVPAE